VSKRTPEQRRDTIADIVTSENPEFLDLVAVKAAVEFVLKEDPRTNDTAIVRRTVEYLRQSSSPVDDGTPEDRAATAEGVAEAKEATDTDPEGEVPADANVAPLANVVTTVPHTGFTPPPVSSHPFPSLTRVDMPKVAQATIAEIIEWGYTGIYYKAGECFLIGERPPVEHEASPLAAETADETKWAYRLDDVKALPQQYRREDGFPDKKALDEAMKSPTPPNIPGCVISERKR
jgi:hypothetical protein